MKMSTTSHARASPQTSEQLASSPLASSESFSERRRPDRARTFRRLTVPMPRIALVDSETAPSRQDKKSSWNASHFAAATPMNPGSVMFSRQMTTPTAPSIGGGAKGGGGSAGGGGGDAGGGGWAGGNGGGGGGGGACGGGITPRSSVTLKACNGSTNASPSWRAKRSLFVVLITACADTLERSVNTWTKYSTLHPSMEGTSMDAGRASTSTLESPMPSGSTPSASKKSRTPSALAFGRDSVSGCTVP
mmetsp:Transcript_31009/g.66583  ORF Transcript_31009/g.66583 Transcript_31009/m.66583 type:complete len:248 (+) Transcript_31009:954-1697(+)